MAFVSPPADGPVTRERPAHRRSRPGNDMPNPTRTIEGVPLDTRAGLWASCCENWTLVETDVAIVDASSLELLRTVTGSTCLGCGASD